MRALALLAVALVVAVAAWAVFGQPARVPEPVDPGAATEPADRGPPAPRTGNLVIRVTAPDGSVPEGAEVGYVERGGRVRWLYARDGGARQFADAPLGDVEVAARAPGYREARARRQLVAGVPEEVRLVLQRRTD